MEGILPFSGETVFLERELALFLEQKKEEE